MRQVVDGCRKSFPPKRRVAHAVALAAASQAVAEAAMAWWKQEGSKPPHMVDMEDVNAACAALAELRRETP